MTTTTTATGSTAVQAATTSLLTSLGSGSGIDTGSLVTSLVEAQFAVQTARLTKKSETLTAQISGIATVKSAISGFATALDTLAKSGTLATQPKSSASAVLSATAQPGAKLSALSAAISVDRLATAQTATSAKVTVPGADGPVAASRATALGSGRFTLRVGSANYATAADGTATMDALTPPGGSASVDFDLADATVDTLAAAINANGARLGITAAVVTGVDGSAYLSLKGATGSASAFTLSVDGADSANLKQFEVGNAAPMRITAQARNAELTIDGVAVERATNTIGDLVPGVTLQLAGTGAATLSATRPTEALTQAVTDVVDTYNQVLAILQAQTDAASGTLAGDPAAKALLRGLKAMTLQPINPAAAGDAPRTLAELGVRTARDGTLSVDATALSGALTRYPDAVEGMFASSATAGTGLPARLKALSDTAASAGYGLGASVARYTAAQSDLAKAQAKIADQSDAMTTRLTGQFAAMNARVSAYKSVQSFLTNQIAAWNKSDG